MTSNIAAPGSMPTPVMTMSMPQPMADMPGTSVMSDPMPGMTDASTTDAAAAPAPVRASASPTSIRVAHKPNALAIVGGALGGAALLGIGAALMSHHLWGNLDAAFHAGVGVSGASVGALVGGASGYLLTGGSFRTPKAEPRLGAPIVPPFSGVPTTPSDEVVPRTVTGVVADRSKVVPGGPVLQVQRIDAKLSSPVQVTSTPSDPDHLYVVQQGGQVVRTNLDGTGKQVVVDLSSRIRSGGEQGLLSVAFHPGFATNGRLFVNYTDTEKGDTRVVELKMGANHTVDPGSAKELLHIAQPYANHNGGQLQFGPDGDLYIGMGDGGGGGDQDLRAQNPTTLLGKMLRIDVDHAAGGKPYAVPADNPFADGMAVSVQTLAPPPD